MGGGRPNTTQRAEPYGAQTPYVGNLYSNTQAYGQFNPYSNRQTGGQQGQFPNGPAIGNAQSSVGLVASNPQFGMPASSGNPYGGLASLLQTVFSNNGWPSSGNHGGVPGSLQMPAQNYPPQFTQVARGAPATTDDRANRLGTATNALASMLGRF